VHPGSIRERPSDVVTVVDAGDSAGNVEKRHIAVEIAEEGVVADDRTVKPDPGATLGFVN